MIPPGKKFSNISRVYEAWMDHLNNQGAITSGAIKDELSADELKEFASIYWHSSVIRCMQSYNPSGNRTSFDALMSSALRVAALEAYEKQEKK